MRFSVILQIAGFVLHTWCAPSPARATAAEELWEGAITHVAGNQWTEARRLLEEALEGGCDTPDLRLLLGVAAAREGDLDRGRENLARAARDHSLLAGYALLSWAALETEAGNPERSLLLWREAAETGMAPNLNSQALLAQGDLLARLGRTARAKEVWEELLISSPPDSLSVPALDRLSLLALAEESWPEAQRWLCRLSVEHPLTPEATAAERKSLELVTDGLASPCSPSAADLLRQGRTLLAADRWREALPVLEEATARTGDAEREEALILLAGAQLKHGLLDQAQRSYLEVGERMPPADVASRALLGLLRVCLRRGEVIGAEDLWVELGESSPHSESYRAATVLLAGHWGGKKRWDQVSFHCRAWLDRAGGGAGQGEVLWRLAWAEMRAGSIEGARCALENLSAQRDADYAAAGLFWVSRLCRREGDSRGAVSWARELSRRFPLSYYGYRAAAVTGEGDGRPSGAGRVIESRAVRDSLHASPVSPSQPESWRRASSLWGLGLAPWALEELLALDEAGELGPSMMPMFLAAAASAGRWSEGLAKVREHYAESLVRGATDPSSPVWAAAYPRPFAEQVRSAAAASGLDANLLWALAREESGFDTYARSRAGALGLLQLMPETVAAGPGVGPDRVRREELLFRPGENLRLGAQYLSSLLERWSGNLPLALAAYNAGPSRALRWWREGTASDLDEFVDTIPYRETRVFVKRVLASYWEYQRLETGRVRASLVYRWDSGAATTSPSTPQGKRAR